MISHFIWSISPHGIYICHFTVDSASKGVTCFIYLFFIFFCLTNWNRKEMTFHVELQYSVCSCILPHTLTSLYQLIFSDPRNKRVETP